MFNFDDVRKSLIEHEAASQEEQKNALLAQWEVPLTTYGPTIDALTTLIRTQGSTVSQIIQKVEHVPLVSWQQDDTQYEVRLVTGWDLHSVQRDPLADIDKDFGVQIAANGQEITTQVYRPLLSDYHVREGGGKDWTFEEMPKPVEDFTFSHHQNFWVDSDKSWGYKGKPTETLISALAQYQCPPFGVEEIQAAFEKLK
jgi:hypothetical protein